MTDLSPIDSSSYDAWYRTSRGAWIGDVEYHLLARMLQARPGESVLDVGCGTGYFTRRFAIDSVLRATGLDIDDDSLDFARGHSPRDIEWAHGDARGLPFPDGSFDHAISVTALCFVGDARQALAEILRVARRRFAVGLLNRHSLLYPQKGRDGGRGAYRGAHWHTHAEIRALLKGLPASNLKIRTGVFVPAGGAISQAAETLLPGVLPWGAFIAVAGDTSRGAADQARNSVEGLSA